jgi:hypothetical protein
MSIARQRVDKQDFLTTEDDIFREFTQSDIKKCSAAQMRTVVESEVKSRVFGIGSCRIMARKKLGWEKKTSCVI